MSRRYKPHPHEQQARQDAIDGKKPRGAKPSQETAGRLLRSWLRHHKTSFQASLARLLAYPLQSLLTWMVIAIALALPAALYLGLKNVQKLGHGWQDSTQMSAFLAKGASEEAVQALSQRLQQQDGIDGVEVIDPSQALSEFQTYSGLGDVLTHLDENPLPAVLVVQPASHIDSPAKLSQLQTQVAQEALIASVQLDMGWLQRLYELLSLGERIVFVLATLLALGVLLIVGNTLRLAIENRRDEIVVIKLVGGTDGFVRRPFLYTGFWYGMGGGILAVVLLWLASLWVSAPIQRLVSLYESNGSLEGLGLSGVACLLFIAGLLGWVGAWVAVSRHLRVIEPC